MANFDLFVLIIAERQTPGEEELLEGLLVRKHEWDSTTKRAQAR